MVAGITSEILDLGGSMKYALVASLDGSVAGVTRVTRNSGLLGSF